MFLKRATERSNFVVEQLKQYLCITFGNMWGNVAEKLAESSLLPLCATYELWHFTLVSTWPFGCPRQHLSVTLQSLPFCFKKFRRSLGSMACHSWPSLWYVSVCLTVWTCMLQQAFRKPLLFFSPEMAPTCWLFFRSQMPHSDLIWCFSDRDQS